MSLLRRSLLLAVPVLLATASTATAVAAGPVQGGTAFQGVAASGVRYLAVPAGNGTLLERIATAGGKLLRTRWIHGTFTVPLVAADGAAGGLSADGRTLVVASPHTDYPQARSTLAILDARRILPRRVLRLKGDFSYDAVSPDGSTLYLTQLTSRDLSRYAVRALDVATGRLLPGAIVDATEPDEPMRGFPVTRVTGPGGRFEYTLYTGGDHPFVHKLDTVRMRAACLELPGIKDASAMRLRLEGRRLAVLSKGTPVAYVDTLTRHVAAPPAASPAPAPAAAARPGEGGGAAWGLVAGIAAAGAALCAAALLLVRRRRATLHSG
jgi:hypothetical protein